MPTTYPAERGPSDSSSVRNSKSDDALLKRIRERFDYMVRAWKTIRDDRALSMQALSPLGPWDAAERARRKELKRPCIHFPQLDQYANNLINEIRQNPLGIKVMPVGNGANDQTAALLSDRIRQVEYEANAIEAYRIAFENAVQGGYGVFSLLTEYASWDSFDLRIKVRAYPNPDVVYWDPDCKETDCSDMKDAITIDRIRKSDFERDWPDAQVTSFSDGLTATYPEWFDKETVQVASYLYIEPERRTLYLLDDGSGQGVPVYRDELDAGFKVQRDKLIFANGQELKILRKKSAEKPVVKQAVTNGIEILYRTTLLGSTVPVFPVIGREKYVAKDGAGSKKVERVLESYIRNGIDPQMLFDYYKTTEAEVVKMTPKTPFVGYTGQFETHKEDWEKVSDEPLAFLQADPKLDATGQAVLPLPERQPYEPAIQALEVGAEAARRSIQSALGSYGFTRLDDTNVKSGKAINALDRQSDMGSFHFIDNLKSTLRRAGKYYVEILPLIEDTAKDVGIRKEDGTHELIRLNEQVQDPKTGQPVHHQYGSKDAQHDVTISTGPSYQSQREEAADFATTLAAQPDLMARIGDLVVKLKNLGPIGDQIAERLKPPKAPAIPPEVQREIQQYEMALNDAMKQMGDLKKIIDGKQVESASKEQLKMVELASNEHMNMVDNDIKLAIAELNAKTKMSSEDLSAFMTRMDHTLQLLIQESQQAHEVNLAEITHKYNAETGQIERAR